MTSWTPDLTRRSGPRYRALADALADDVAGGRLAARARPPTAPATAPPPGGPVRAAGPRGPARGPHGAQQALSIALAALAAPGDLVLTEALTYPLFRTLAGLLHLKIQGLPMDDQGLKPEAFEAVCRAGAPRFLYCIPTIQNPTVSIM